MNLLKSTAVLISLCIATAAAPAGELPLAPTTPIGEFCYEKY